MRILRICHSAVVDEYRERERKLHGQYGHDVHVVCPPVWEEGGQLVRPTLDDELPVHLVPISGRRQPNLFWYRMPELRAVIRSVRPEIIDVHEEPYSLAAGFALRAAGLESPEAKICVYTAQNLDRRYPPPFSWIERRVLRSASAAYPCSVEAGERLRARGFMGPISVLPLGVTLPAPAPRAPGPPRVGFVGRFEPYKGGMIALRAYMAAAATGDAVLEVIGDGSQAAAMRAAAGGPAAMRAAAGGSTAAERVVFTGALSQGDTLERIGHLDILLVPSLSTPTWKEQFGRVAAQAMAAGVAVVASDSGSLREVVGDAGILVREGDVGAFTEALRGLLDDPARRVALGERGRRRASEKFSWDAVAAGVDEMYREMAESGARVRPARSAPPSRCPATDLRSLEDRTYQRK
jgi:glycosyltransferase involved in cell wall biosynthesis